MLIYLSLKKNEVKKHFKVRFHETFLEYQTETLYSPIVSRHLRRVHFFATYRMCYVIPDYYLRLLFHQIKRAIVVSTSNKTCGS